MSYLPTDPADFATQAIDGFAAAYPRHVRRIDGGVMRLAPIPSGQMWSHVASLLPACSHTRLNLS